MLSQQFVVVHQILPLKIAMLRVAQLCELLQTLGTAGRVVCSCIVKIRGDPPQRSLQVSLALRS